MNSTNINGSTRRTFSSPYLKPLRDPLRSQKPKPGSGNRNSDRRTPRAACFPKPTPPARAGSRSAPPNFHFLHPEIQDYYNRRTELQKEVKKSLLKSKLNTLQSYQAQLAREIRDLEQSSGEQYGSRILQPKKQIPKNNTATPKLKQFRVLGGCPGNLSYKIHKKPDKDGKVRSFSLEVDVRGFMPENIAIETQETMMVVSANKLSGIRRDLKVITPSTKDMEKSYVHHPKLGVLLIDF